MVTRHLFNPIFFLLLLSKMFFFHFFSVNASRLGYMWCDSIKVFNPSNSKTQFSMLQSHIFLSSFSTVKKSILEWNFILNSNVHTWKIKSKLERVWERWAANFMASSVHFYLTFFVRSEFNFPWCEREREISLASRDRARLVGVLSPFSCD